MRRFPMLLAVIAALALAATVLAGVRHDYADYLKQWALVLAHQDPWATNNAYGPLHNAFALLVPLHPLAPKVLTAASLLLANGLLLIRLAAERTDRAWLGPYLLLFGGNILVLVSAFWFGLNDAFVAALILGAVLARFDRLLVLAGILLGLATLEKYYPALLIPFFALDQRRLEPRLPIAALLTIAAGMVAAMQIWGSDWFEAIAYGVSRDATILSPLRPLVALGRALGAGDAANLLVRFNGPLVLLVWLLCLWAAWRRREHWLVAATWGFVTALLTYKVGNQQFWIAALALCVALPLAGRPEADRLMRLAVPYAVFLSLFQIGYVVLQPQYYQGRWLWVNDVAGVPSFLLGALLLARFLWPHPGRHSREGGNPDQAHGRPGLQSGFPPSRE